MLTRLIFSKLNRMKTRLIKIVGNKWIIVTLYALFVIITGIQAANADKRAEQYNGVHYTSYNNYLIFKSSHTHLKNGEDLYIYHPEDHFDLFKYTPTFAAFFGVFAVFPDWLGLTLWNMLNAMMLLIGVYYLPKLSNFKKGFLLLVVVIELVTSLQNHQSNGLMAGLLIAAFGLLENKKMWAAALLIVCSVFVKLFGIVGFALFLFYPSKWKLALYTVAWTILLALIPFIWIDLEQYTALATSYFNMLSMDHSASEGYSVMGWLSTWFNINVNKNSIVLLGIVLFLVPLAQFKLYKNINFKYLILSSILVWIVIFNHKAESPTFIIAMAGAALWYVLTKKNTLNNVLFWTAFVFASLSPTDVFPVYIREEFVKPYVLKAVPCILIWVKITWDLLFFSKTRFVLDVKNELDGNLNNQSLK